MAINKKEVFSESDQQLAIIAKALSHPARIAIIRKLSCNDSCVCGDIVEDLPLAQSTVSQHLKELKQVGLIQGSIDGPRSCYCVDKKKWQEIETLMSTFLSDMRLSQTKLNCC